MSAFEIFVAIYMAAVPPALGYLFWGRMNRLESRMDAFEVKVTSEFGVLRAELRQEFSDVRQEIAGLRGELVPRSVASVARCIRGSQTFERRSQGSALISPRWPLP